MNILTLLIAVLARPEMPPLGPAEIGLYERLTKTQAVAPTVPVIAPGDVVPGRFAVGFDPGRPDAAFAAADRCEAEVLMVDSVLGFAVMRAGSQAELAASAGPGVRYIEPDCVMRAARIPDDPMFLRYQWDKWVMYADKAWDLLTGAPGVKVGIVDNGVDYSHPDLAHAFTPGDLGYDFVGNDADPRPDLPSHPEAFHGTHVSGIVAAAIDNRIGVAGWAQVQLYGVKVLSDSGTGNTTSLASGIRWAVDHGCRVVNMSLGGQSAPTPLVEACQYAVANNVLLIAASGNEGSQSVNFPAALNECVAVGALDPGSYVATFSNRGAQVELCAPGVDVTSTVPGGSFASASGTSMATPEVTGVGALLFAQDPTMTAAEVRALMAAGSIDLGTPGRDYSYGFGLVNARRALDLAAAVRGVRVASVSAVERVGTGFGVLAMPGWAKTAEVLDCSGRLAARSGPAAAVGTGLPTGVYAVRFTGPGRRASGRLVRPR
jgi:subtilisin family serine protease